MQIDFAVHLKVLFSKKYGLTALNYNHNIQKRDFMG